VYLEHVQRSPGVETTLLENSIEDGSLRTLFRSKRCRKVKLESLGNQVLEFNLVANDVGGCPGLGQSNSVDFVRPFALNIPNNVVAFGIVVTLDLERDIGRGLGFKF
jgi:hypothetical protein